MSRIKTPVRFEIITAFPQTFEGAFSQSIIARAKRRGLITIKLHDLRQYGDTQRRTIDDKPFGGGPGMVLKVEPIYKAVMFIKNELGSQPIETILLSPQGKPYNQKGAQSLSQKGNIILICGHYEGVDERIVKILRAKELSVGDYILSGGEVAAMAVVDSVTRLLNGALGKPASLNQESFSRTGEIILDHPSFTRPRKFLDHSVPKILLSGDHLAIEKWRREKALRKTKKNRPDLFTQRG